ncbi:S1C family serine protease [Corynebacterium lujinxingii]|uniref:Trypsin-like peptidase domain-containing protein n=1 Tax=Corynebacterium lujinxingii TaxID=2763010 RepID=A0A7H0K0G7_9CORY|nr:trypsin-like peptidase domain-containing protein [Corynebacterium lujinxingii]MBC3179477.1 trypsin-like peptidase domain-containing protein [Corynebacterium lujinxingii]NNO11581.1 PDZ domain-containing protein [Corynebacterium lujinxingii]QNP90783.1 trypsin-like peptidase domain-containing protein [Corynebacterium lujinxingii]
MSNESDFGETARFPRHEDQSYHQPEYAPSGGVYPVPPQAQPKQKRRSGAGTAFAVALVTALAAGGGAGYLAGGAGSAGDGEARTESPLGEPSQAPENALENPSVAKSEDAPEGSVEKVAAAVLPSVVSIGVATRGGGAEGSGSIISSDGYVLTNHHVVAAGAEPGTEIQVTLNDGSRHPAQFVASDVNTDIGVIKIEGVDNLPVIQFGDSHDLNVGQQVVAVGSPLGLSATVTTGIVSALNRPVRASQGGGESSLMDGIQTDAAINPGNSGGPLVDMEGHLIGMNSVIASLSTGGFGSEGSGGSIGLGFAIPSNFAKRVAEQLIANGEATQPMLGVQVSIAQAMTGGAVVAAVEPGSPGEQAGLKRGDVITRLDDRVIDSADALIAATRSQDFGQTVTLQVEREGESEPIPVEVTLSSE